MAKRSEIPPVVLSVISGTTLATGWMLGPFPLLTFMGMAPLFALTDRAEEADRVWEKMEWILLALVTSFLAAFRFDLNQSVKAMVLGIVFTFPFVAHVWVRKSLGKRAGKISIILFWLAIEYVLLKLLPEQAVFLGDSLGQEAAWTQWNTLTGFLGASFWILLVNLIVYRSLFSGITKKWPLIVLAVCTLMGPLIYSYSLHVDAITRDEMIALYSGRQVKDVMYLARGEFIVRTAAWLSTLILLFTFVKSQISR